MEIMSYSPWGHGCPNRSIPALTSPQRMRNLSEAPRVSPQKSKRPRGALGPRRAFGGMTAPSVLVRSLPVARETRELQQVQPGGCEVHFMNRRHSSPETLSGSTGHTLLTQKILGQQRERSPRYFKPKLDTWGVLMAWHTEVEKLLPLL